MFCRFTCIYECFVDPGTWNGPTGGAIPCPRMTVWAPKVLPGPQTGETNFKILSLSLSQPFD